MNDSRDRAADNDCPAALAWYIPTRHELGGRRRIRQPVPHRLRQLLPVQLQRTGPSRQVFLIVMASKIPTYDTCTAGTFWYHSHIMTQYCDGLRGVLVVYDPQDPHAHLYDVDDGEQYHKPHLARADTSCR